MAHVNKYIMVFFFLSFLFFLSFALSDGILLPFIYLQVKKPYFYEWAFIALFILWLFYHFVYEIKNTRIKKNSPFVQSVTAHLLIGALRFFFKIFKGTGRLFLYSAYVVSLVLVFFLMLKFNEWLILYFAG